MAKRISKLKNSLKQLGEIQVNDWDFKELLNTDIKELEVSRFLRRLGRIHVMDWDFRTALPAVKKVANQEVDLVDLIKRTANYKVLDWDFRNAMAPHRKATPSQPGQPSGNGISRAEPQALSDRLKNFLQFVVVNLIDEPNHAQISVIELRPNEIQLKLVMVKRDVAMLIGIQGFTAAAIRSILKSVAAMHGVKVLLKIHSHEEEIEMNTRNEAQASISVRKTPTGPPRHADQPAGL